MIECFSQNLWNWQVYSDVVTFFCVYGVIYLTDLYSGFIKTKITKPQKNLLFRNQLAGLVTLVKLKLTIRSQFFFAFYNQPGQISVNRFFQINISSCLFRLS